MSDTQTISVSFIKKIWATDDLDDDGLRWGIYITKDSNNKRVVIKGKLNDELATPGSQFNVIGKWIVDPKYGQQFEFGTYARCLPFGEYGTKVFLRRADNIGSVAADKIYSMYGDNSINVVINHPDKVITECDLKPHVVNEAAAKFRAERDGIETLLPLISLFGDTKIPDKTAHKIISMGWKDAVSSIKKNPFKLMKIPNIGFKKCDSLRIKLKLQPEDPERVQAACLQVFKDSSDQVWLKPDQLKSAMQEMLEIPDVRVSDCVESLIVDGMITARWSGRAGSEYMMQTWYGLKKHYEEEEYISKRIFESSLDHCSNWPVDEIENDQILTRHQKDVIIHNMNSSGRIMLLPGSPGTGKLLAHGEPVLTPSGWVNVEDIKEGYHVIGSNGRKTEVVGVYPQGKCRITRVTFSDGRSVDVSDDHLWGVYDMGRNIKTGKRGGGPRGQYRVMTTKQIAETIFRSDGAYRYKIPMVAPVEFEDTAEGTMTPSLPIDPYLLGVILGDGGITHSIKITTPDEPIIREIERRIDKKIKRLKTKHHKCPEWSANFLRRELKQMNLLGKKSTEKHIPNEYLRGTSKDRWDLLAGLLDTDGYTNGQSIEYTTSSFKLHLGVKELVWSLGGTVSVTSRIPTYTYKGSLKEGSRSYRMVIKVNGNPFILPRKKEKYIPKTKYKPARYFKSIGFVGYNKATCIEVDAPNGLFVTKDYIVTHNTFSLSKIIKMFMGSGKTFRAAAPTGKAAQRLTETLESHRIYAQATTIHRMLEPKPLENGDFKFGLQGQDGNSFVDADVIAVDEMSMCNNNLAYHMLKGIRPDTYVILVGDRNQLPPIGPGTFLRDFQELGYKELTEIQRNAGGIVKTCAAIRDGHPITLPHTRNPGINVTPDTNAQIVTTPKKDSAKRTKVEKFLQSLVDGKVENVTDPMEDVQFITATHNNDQVGRNALNKMIQGVLNPNGRGGHVHYKIGDKIICTKNSQLKNSDNDPQFVANGELGYVTLSEPKYIKARMNNNPASEITIPCGPDLGGGWDLGFCITCHKSQGSEWPVVVIVIGSDYGTELVTSREWIYTALSRAKSCSIVISSPAQLQEMYKKIKIWDRKSFILENIRNLQHENSQVSVDAAN